MNPVSISKQKANAVADAEQQTQPLIGLAKLCRMAFSGMDLTPVGQQLLARLAINPEDANALMDMSIVLHLTGNRELGIAMQHQALLLQQVYRLGPDDDASAARLLALVSPGDLTENNAVEFLLEDSDVVLELLYLAPELPLPQNLLEHDLAMVAVSESDRNRVLLQSLQLPLANCAIPLINHPEYIARLSRDGAAALLAKTPGIVMPVTVRIGRNTLLNIGNDPGALSAYISDGDFPIIARPVDSHKGIGLARLNSALDIINYLQQQPEPDFYISRFIDYRSTDGLFRKYRIVLMDGRPYICHMAISEHWMVHYMSAGMLDSASKREEEARCMATFDEDFAQRHQQAFDHLAETLALDYVGLDCGETPDGKLLIFEVDSSMTVHAMDSADIFPYKKAQMQKVFEAFRALLLSRKDTVQSDLPGSAFRYAIQQTVTKTPSVSHETGR